MSLSLTNRDDVVANSVSLIQASGLYDLGESVLDVATAITNKADKTTVYAKTETYNKPEVNALLSTLSDTTVSEQLLLKADIADVTAALLLKSDKIITYTKTDVDTLLAPKANSSDISASLALKADKANSYVKTEIDTFLATKTDDDEMVSALALKMNISNAYSKTEINAFLDTKPDETEVDATFAMVDAAIALKADTATVNSALALKSNTADVITALALKADLSTVNSSLSLKANTTDVNTALTLKSNIIDVSNSLNLKANTSDVNAALALKADLSAVDAVQLGLTTKADKTTTYTKTEADVLLTVKANASDVAASLTLKADKTTVNSSLALKADMTYVDENLGLKANKTYVDSQLTQKASIGYVDQKVFDGIASVVNTAPLALDTLNELAAALGDDANYAATVQTQFGFKADKATTYTKTEADTLLNEKAAATELALKANQSTTYTKTETNNLLSQKAATSDLDLKANAADIYTKTQVNTMLNTKADDDEVYAALTLKANASDTYTKTQANGLLDAKANKTDVDASLLLKANTSDVYSKVQIETKLAGTAQLDDVLTLFQLTDITGGHTVDLSSKANKTYVDEQLLLKANLTDVFNKTQVSGFLNEKANVVDVYTIAQANGLLSLKANYADVYNKIDTDTLLTTLGNNKANVVDVFNKAQVSGFLTEKANVVDVYTITQAGGLLSLKANSADVYNKTDTDSLLTTLGNSKANVVDVFNKTQVSGFLNEKANSLDVFTVAETNGLLLLKANSADVYSKTDTDTLLTTLGNSKANTADVNTALNAKVPWVYDSALTLDAIHTDILRPKKAGQTHIKIDTDLTVVGTCNISNSLVVNGRNVLSELSSALALASPTITGICTVTGSLVVQGVNIINELQQKQSLISRVEPAGGIRGLQLWEGDTMRNLKAGRNTTITADWDALTIGGLGNGGGALGGITRLINETSKNVKALKAGTGITLVDDTAYDAITINVPDIPTIQSNIALKANSDDVYAKTTLDGMLAQKQRTLWIGAPSVGVSLVDSGYIVSGLNATAPLSVSKASGVITIASDTYSKDEIEVKLAGKEAALNPIAPLKIAYNPQGGTWDLKIDPLLNMSVWDMTVSGNLTVDGWFGVKPYVAFYFAGGAVSTTVSPGFIPRSYVMLTNRTSGTLYNFSFPTHPNGQNYMVVVQPRTGSTTSAYFTCTANVISATNFLVWCRNASNTIVDGEFYAYTVP